MRRPCPRPRPPPRLLRPCTPSGQAGRAQHPRGTNRHDQCGLTKRPLQRLQRRPRDRLAPLPARPPQLQEERWMPQGMLHQATRMGSPEGPTSGMRRASRGLTERRVEGVQSPLVSARRQALTVLRRPTQKGSAWVPAGVPRRPLSFAQRLALLFTPRPRLRRWCTGVSLPQATGSSLQIEISYPTTMLLP